MAMENLLSEKIRIIDISGFFRYCYKQKDLISDKIPVIGIADDLAVLGLALKMSEPELKAFSAWRAAKNGSIQGEKA